MNDKKNLIYFFSLNEEYGFLSNFFERSIYSNGLLWKSSEHYYQSCKFSDKLIKEKIRSKESPLEAALLGRSLTSDQLDNWEDIKLDSMRRAIILKFTQHYDLLSRLFDTEESQLLENNPNDYFWSVGKDHSGENHLGKILMSCRKFLKKYFI